MTRSLLATATDLIGQIRDNRDWGTDHVSPAIAIVRSWLDDCNMSIAALVELHAAMLYQAGQVSRVADFLDPAAVLFGLVRALEPRGDYGVITSRSGIPTDVIVNTITQAICSAVTTSFDGGQAKHLDLARSWLAHAYLHAGSETPGSAQ